MKSLVQIAFQNSKLHKIPFGDVFPKCHKIRQPLFWLRSPPQLWPGRSLPLCLHFPCGTQFKFDSHEFILAWGFVLEGGFRQFLPRTQRVEPIAAPPDMSNDSLHSFPIECAEVLSVLATDPKRTLLALQGGSDGYSRIFGALAAPVPLLTQILTTCLPCSCHWFVSI